MVGAAKDQRYGPAIVISVVTLISASAIIGYLEYQRRRAIAIAKLEETVRVEIESEAAAETSITDLAQFRSGKPIGTPETVGAVAGRAADAHYILLHNQWRIRQLEGFDDPEPSPDQTAFANLMVDRFNQEVKTQVGLADEKRRAELEIKNEEEKEELEADEMELSIALENYDGTKFELVSGGSSYPFSAKDRPSAIMKAKRWCESQSPPIAFEDSAVRLVPDEDEKGKRIDQLKKRIAELKSVSSN